MFKVEVENVGGLFRVSVECDERVVRHLGVSFFRCGVEVLGVLEEVFRDYE